MSNNYMDDHLPGWPSKTLIRRVRRHLNAYGIRPSGRKLWAAAWEWAAKFRYSYVYPRWPSPSEIGSMYLTLLLAEMKTQCGLRLPSRALANVPDSVRAIVGIAPVLQVEAEPEVLALPPPAVAELDPEAVRRRLANAVAEFTPEESDQ